MWNDTKGEQDNLCLALINPRLCKKLSIKVAVEQHDTKTTVPYLHVFLDNTWNLKNCAFIRLDKPEYVPEKNSKRLSTKQKEELIYILTRECNGNWIASIIDKSNIKAATGYETAVQTWIDTYEGNNKIQYDKNGFLVMPDYTKLQSRKLCTRDEMLNDILLFVFMPVEICEMQVYNDTI